MADARSAARGRWHPGSRWLVCLGVALVAVGLQGAWPNTHWIVWTAGALFGAAMVGMFRAA